MDKIIDSHLHLNDKIEGPAQNAVDVLNQELINAGVTRSILLHLDIQRWSAEEVAQAIKGNSRISAFINIHPNDPKAKEKLNKGIKHLGFIGLKLHPRLQKFDMNTQETYELVQYAGELGVPVLLDAFPDGDWLMMGFDPVNYAKIAKACPNTNIIAAHFGGHYCIDFMMLAKRVENLYLDLSFSLLYYQGSSVVADIMYCCKSMKYKKVFFGSDYPDRSLPETVKQSINLFKQHGVQEDDLKRLFYLNAKEFFGWEDI